MSQEMKNSTKWLIRVLIGVILIGIGLLIGYFLFKNNSDTAINTSSTPAVDTSKDTEENTTETEEENRDGLQTIPEWNIFKNSHGYYIEYPDGATIENASGTEGEKDKDPTEAYCVKISTEHAWIKIASRDKPDDIHCHRTGIGTEWGEAPDEEVTIAGQKYTAEGMLTESASAGYYNDEYGVEIVSGEVIAYGVSVNEKYDDGNKTEAKELVHKMLSTFGVAE